MYEDKPTPAQAGDVVHQRPGIVHCLYDYPRDGVPRNSQPGGIQDRRHAARHRQGAAGDALEVALPVVAERINVCRRRLLRSVALALDVVRRMGLRPISSREHGSTSLNR